jgi:hypothetical protein
MSEAQLVISYQWTGVDQSAPTNDLSRMLAKSLMPVRETSDTLAAYNLVLRRFGLSGSHP